MRLRLSRGGEPDIRTSIVGPNVMRIGRQQQFYIVTQNNGSVDALRSRVWVAVPRVLSSAWGMIAPQSFVQTKTTSYFAFDLPSIGVGATFSLPISLLAPSVAQAIKVQAWPEVN
jgi:hypothetical protein